MRWCLFGVEWVGGWEEGASVEARVGVGGWVVGTFTSMR